MRVVIFTVCRSARSAKSRLTITEAFSNLALPALPARISCALATRLFFTAEEEGVFEGSINLIDPDGRSLLKSLITLEVPPVGTDGTGIYLDSIGQFQATLNTAGEYQFHIAAIGEEPTVFPLYVNTKRR